MLGWREGRQTLHHRELEEACLEQDSAARQLKSGERERNCEVVSEGVELTNLSDFPPIQCVDSLWTGLVTRHLIPKLNKNENKIQKDSTYFCTQ